MPNRVVIIKLSIALSGLNGFEFVLMKLEDNNNTTARGGGSILNRFGFELRGQR